MPFPVEIAHVKRAEAELGRSLPLGYKVALCHANGGDVEAGGQTWFLFPIHDDSDRTRIKRTTNHIVRETRGARERPGFPQGALAIGENGGGDLLVLLPDSEGPRFLDAVYWWDHETDELHEVAADFAELE